MQITMGPIFGVLFILGVATAYGQTPAPALPVAVQILTLPPEGDPMVIPPVKMEEIQIGPSVYCNLDRILDDPNAPTYIINPTHVSFDDPFTPGRSCLVPRSLNGIPNGENYRSVAIFKAVTCIVNGAEPTPCLSPRSEVGVPPFRRSDIQFTCGPDASGKQAVKLVVGTWSRNVAPNAYGFVTYGLTLSRDPVDTVIVMLAGKEIDRLVANDLRKVYGSYFVAPNTRGSYQLTVEARSGTCTDGGASRPMTVNVK
jgi:hypothetical protein